jgi:hypothetical protein
MANNKVAEPFLKAMRAFRTFIDVRRFESNSNTRNSASNAENWRMRSAMDLHPRMGKVISRLAVRGQSAGIPSLDIVRTSNFVHESEIDLCIESLRSDGVFVFKNRLPQSMVDQMLAAALERPAQARGKHDQVARFPRGNPSAGRYDIDEDATMVSAAMQDYASDPALAYIAAKYLKQPAIQDQTALWWTTTEGASEASINAWLFHQDRDRLSFVKFFTYLTDVGPDNGPHAVIKGTHRKIPRALASDGRKDDALVRKLGLWDKVESQLGPAGTMIAVDTIGLHKGQPPVSGDRCVIQVEYATSLFGAHPDFPSFQPSELSRQRYEQMPNILQRWEKSINAATS